MIVKSAEFTISFGLASQLPEYNEKEVVISGRSNVGKSSIINKMCNRKSLARVSGQPGKTGTINYYKVNDFFLVDLPGYGFAKVSHKERIRWDNLINGYFKSREDKLSVVIQLIDSRHKPSNDDYTMLEYLTYNKIPFIIALTKADKLKKTQYSEAIDTFKDYCQGYTYGDIILTSSEKGDGVQALLDKIEEFLQDEEEIQDVL